MKILFLCKRYYTNKDLLGDRFGRLFHLPLQLSRLGASVSVIAVDYRNATPISEQIDGVVFQTAPATVMHLPSLLHKLRRSIRSLQPDVIIASGDSHIGYVASRFASDVDAKFVFDVYDYYPAFPGNRIPGMRAMFRAAIRRADLTLCASVPLMEKLSQRSKKLTLVDNGVDRQLFVAMDRKSAREAVGISMSVPLVGYFGAVTPKRGPLLFAAVQLLRAEMPDLRVLLAGRLAGYKVTEEFVDYKGELSQDRLPTLISACDVVSVPYQSDPQIDLAGACKIAEYLACGRPVVATRVAGHDLVFKDVPSSLCDPEPVDFARALKSQLRDPQIASFPEHLDWSQIGLKTYRALDAL